MNTKYITPTKSIVLISMIYISLFFASLTVGYKIVAFGNELYCASILIFPLLFPLSDALSEIYGPSIAKSMVWYTILCEIIFVTLTNIAIRLPSPADWHHQAEYNFLVGGYVHILIANSTALLVSFYLNVYFVSKWRVILKGKYYYLRSLGATAIGEISYTIITNLIAYYGVLSFNKIVNIIISDYFVKLLYSIIIAYPAALFVISIKMKYQIDGYAKTFNPFKQSLTDKIVNIKDKAQLKSNQKLLQAVDE